MKTDVVVRNKTCPECSIESDERVLVCGCGHLFLEEVHAQGSNELRTIRSHYRKGRLKKFALLGGFLVVPVIGALYWFGVVGSLSKNLFVEQPPPAVAVQPPPVQNLIPPEAKKEQQPDVQYIVTAVLTGDMINLLGSDNQQVHVRIFGIVSPKLDQTFGKESRDNLSRQLLGKTVSLISKRTANDGLVFAEVLRDGINIGVEQVRSGLAQVTGDDLLQKDPVKLNSYSAAEFVARNGRFGIWSDATANIERPDPGGEYSVTPTVSARSNGGSSRSRLSEKRSLYDPPYGSVDPSDGPAVILEGQTSSGRQTSSGDQQPEKVIDVPVPAKEPEASATGGPHPAQTTVSRDRKYTRGSRGGCFYQSAGGNRVYVDRALCN